MHARAHSGRSVTLAAAALRPGLKDLWAVMGCRGEKRPSWRLPSLCRCRALSRGGSLLVVHAARIVQP